jgi:DcmR-like sensory protein
MLRSTTQTDEFVGRQARPGAEWEALLASPSTGRHIVQLYVEHEFLARAVGQFVRDGLRRGEGVVLIATPLHRWVVSRRLESLGLDAQSFQRRGQLLMWDAEETLAGFMGHGVPDRRAFRARIGEAIETLTAAGCSGARAFGEMVDLLRLNDLGAALLLEDLWKEVVAERQITLLCGYSVDTLDPRSYHGLVQPIMASHSDVIPAEDYQRLDRAVERAYVEVFGSHEDARELRHAFLEHFPRPAAMPDAQAAILALREFVPGSADELVASTRRHYYSLAG